MSFIVQIVKPTEIYFELYMYINKVIWTLYCSARPETPAVTLAAICRDDLKMFAHCNGGCCREMLTLQGEEIKRANQSLWWVLSSVRGWPESKQPWCVLLLTIWWLVCINQTVWVEWTQMILCTPLRQAIDYENLYDLTPNIYKYSQHCSWLTSFLLHRR